MNQQADLMKQTSKLRAANYLPLLSKDQRTNNSSLR